MSAAMPQEYVDAFFRFFADGELDESQVLTYDLYFAKLISDANDYTG